MASEWLLGEQDEEPLVIKYELGHSLVLITVRGWGDSLRTKRRFQRDRSLIEMGEQFIWQSHFRHRLINQSKNDEDFKIVSQNLKEDSK